MPGGGHRDFGLEAGVGGHLGGVIPAGVLEVQKHELAVGGEERVVEAVVGGGEGAGGGGQGLIDVEVEAGGLAFEVGDGMGEGGSQARVGEGPDGAAEGLSWGGGHAREAAIQVGDVVAQREGGLGGGREGAGVGVAAFAPEGGEKVGKLAGVIPVELAARGWASGDERIEGDVADGIGGDRCGDGGDAAGVQERKHAELGGEAVAGVARVDEVEFGEVGGVGDVDPGDHVISAGLDGADAGRPIAGEGGDGVAQSMACGRIHDGSRARARRMASHDAKTWTPAGGLGGGSGA